MDTWYMCNDNLLLIDMVYVFFINNRLVLNVVINSRGEPLCKYYCAETIRELRTRTAIIFKRDAPSTSQRGIMGAKLRGASSKPSW